MDWPLGLDLDLNNPSPPPSPPRPLPLETAGTLPALATADFLEELCRSQDDGLEQHEATTDDRPATQTLGKRKRADAGGAEGDRRIASSSADEHDEVDGNGGPGMGEGRTIDRYYDHRIEDGDADADGQLQRRRKNGWLNLLPAAGERDPDGFEVESFQVICPISRLKLARKQREGVMNEIQKRTMWLRILRSELEGDGTSVLLASGDPKMPRSEYKIKSESVEVDWENQEATFIWKEGFRFKDFIEFQVFFYYNPTMTRDAFEEEVCPAYGFSFANLPDSGLRFAKCDESYYLSNAQSDVFYWDLHRYELRYPPEQLNVDPQLPGRIIFKGRVLTDFLGLAKRTMPIVITSVPREDEDEDEDEVEE